MAEDYYPLGAFYFSVKVLDPVTLGYLAADLATGNFGSILTDVDASFQEVSGIESQFNVEEVAEGGENRFVHRLPRNTKYSNLVLKRGAVNKLSFLAEWFGQTIGSSLTLPIIPLNVLVLLLNTDGWLQLFPAPQCGWARLRNCWLILSRSRSAPLQGSEPELDGES
jgi:phage tail-like protein